MVISMLAILSYLVIAFVLLVFLGLVAIDIAGFMTRKPERSYPTGKFRPKTLVIIPCKGLDIGLFQNLSSIKNQRYPDFDVVAVVDSENDEAVPVIRNAGIRYIISSQHSKKASGKVRAISTALEKFRNYSIYAIADSDIRVSSEWLSSLVAPLDDKKTGLSTMYPYFRHIGGFWSEVKSIWGMVGEGLMRRNSSKFGWGGSLAFRKNLLDKESFEFFRNSRYSVSDDICLTLISKKKGLDIAYRSRAQPIVESDDDLPKFWEWANRQTSLSVLGNRSNLRIGIPFYFAESLIIVAGIILSIIVSPIFLLLLLHSLRNGIILFGRSPQKSLAIILIAFMLPFVYLANLAIASRKKTIRWRGSTYSLGR